jgi:hypothetical protein
MTSFTVGMCRRAILAQAVACFDAAIAAILAKEDPAAVQHPELIMKESTEEMDVDGNEGDGCLNQAAAAAATAAAAAGGNRGASSGAMLEQDHRSEAVAVNVAMEIDEAGAVGPKDGLGPESAAGAAVPLFPSALVALSSIAAAIAEAPAPCALAALQALAPTPVAPPTASVFSAVQLAGAESAAGAAVPLFPCALVALSSIAAAFADAPAPCALAALQALAPTPVAPPTASVFSAVQPALLASKGAGEESGETTAGPAPRFPPVEHPDGLGDGRGGGRRDGGIDLGGP